MQKLQRASLQTISWIALLSILSVGKTEADESIKIYSALGSPLIAEIQLLPGELQIKKFSITGKGDSVQQYEVERITDRGALLLLSLSPINQPILELKLVSGDGGIERDFTIFLDPVAPNSSATYIKGLLHDRNRALEVREVMVSRPGVADDQGSWLTDVEQVFSPGRLPVVSKWSLFILLGGLIALVFIRWWRAADPVSITDQDGNFSTRDRGLTGSRQQW